MDDVTAQTVLDNLEKKDKKLAENFRELEKDLIRNLIQLKETSKIIAQEKEAKAKEKKERKEAEEEKREKGEAEEEKSRKEETKGEAEKEKEEKTKEKSKQSHKITKEISPLTSQFVTLLDELTKKKLYQFRPLLITKFKPKLPKSDQSRLEELIEQKDKENGFKKILNKDPLLKIEHERRYKELHKDFRKLKENPNLKLGIIVADKIMYRFLNLTVKEREVLFENALGLFDDETKDRIFEKLDTRPRKSMNRLKRINTPLYKKFIALKEPKDFLNVEHVEYVIRKIKNCDKLESEEKKALIDDLKNREKNIGKEKLELAQSTIKLKDVNRDLYKQFITFDDQSSDIQERLMDNIMRLPEGSGEKDLTLEDKRILLNHATNKYFLNNFFSSSIEKEQGTEKEKGSKQKAFSFLAGEAITKSTLHGKSDLPNNLTFSKTEDRQKS